MQFDAVSSSDAACVYLFDSRHPPVSTSSKCPGIVLMLTESAAAMRYCRADQSRPQQLGDESEYNGAALPKGEKKSFWVRVTKTGIAFGTGAVVGQSAIMSADARALTNAFGDDAWGSKMRIDQASVACFHSGSVSFSNVSVRALDASAASAPMEKAPALCTYTKTGPNFVPNVRYFYCRTCPMDDSNNEGPRSRFHLYF